jgi:molybdate transport system substrate-binding protein
VAKSFLQTSGLWFLLLVGLTGCSKQAPPQANANRTDSIIVSVAASTKDVVETLADDFRKAGGAEVKINSGPSNGLANQILAGGPADLFVSASEQWADEVQRSGQAEKSIKLLTNRLALVVPKANPADVHEPKDLLSPKVKKLALAGEKVPAGMYADQALAKSDLLKALTDEHKIVRGQDVRTALTYVERGEAEAGIVYSTDAATATNVVIVHEFDSSLHGPIVYVLVLLKHGAQNAAARQFYDLLQSATADQVYQKFGFSRLR